MVDDGKIPFNPAVELSYLESSEQRVLLNAMELNDCTPSHAQAIKLKKLSQEGVLNDQAIYEILAEQKAMNSRNSANQAGRYPKVFSLKATRTSKSAIQLSSVEQWRRRRERDRDSR